MYCFKDIPSAKIQSSTTVTFGSDIRFNCSVSGCPYPDDVIWQKSIDGANFTPIDYWKNNNFEDSRDPYSPSLLLRNATLDHQQHYQVIVSNVIGKCTSNRIFLQVTGSMLIYIQVHIKEGVFSGFWLKI